MGYREAEARVSLPRQILHGITGDSKLKFIAIFQHYLACFSSVDIGLVVYPPSVTQKISNQQLAKVFNVEVY